jgi:hypothetical protein
MRAILYYTTLFNFSHFKPITIFVLQTAVYLNQLLPFFGYSVGGSPLLFLTTTLVVDLFAQIGCDVLTIVDHRVILARVMSTCDA